MLPAKEGAVPCVCPGVQEAQLEGEEKQSKTPVDDVSNLEEGWDVPLPKSFSHREHFIYVFTA